MKNCKSMLFVLGFVLLPIAARPAEAPNLTFKFTKVNVSGSFETVPSGVNNARVIVGAYYNKSLVGHGFMLSGKKLTKLSDPKGTSTFCIQLNPNGAIAIVGYYTTDNVDFHGFLYKSNPTTPRLCLAGVRLRKPGVLQAQKPHWRA